MKAFIGILGAISILFVGCSEKSNPTSSQSASAQSVVAVCGSYDFSTGTIGVYSVSNSTAYTNLFSIPSDNDVRTYGGAIYVLERVLGGDNVLKFSSSIITDSTITYETHIGSSVNINDIAFIDSTKAYITQYGSSQLVIFNPSTGAKSSATIDLSAYDTYAGTDSAETVPYMNKALYYNGKVYVTCQRLKSYEPADTSKIVVINATTDLVEKSINLMYKNPQEMSICNGKLYVGSDGALTVNDGGIEVIDLSTDADSGSIVQESAFPGDVASIIVISDTKGYAVISTPSYATELYPFNPQAKTVDSLIAGIDDPCEGHMVYDGTYVYVGDRSSTTPGIVVINPSTNAKVGSTKNIGLPPNSLALLDMPK